MASDTGSRPDTLGYDPLDPAQADMARAKLKELRETCPVAYSPLTGFFYLTRAEDIRGATRNTAVFSNEGTMDSGFGDVRVLVTADDPAHRRQRDLLNASFSAKSVSQLEPYIVTLVDRLIDEFIDAGSCEFVSQFANKIPGDVVCRMLGLPIEDYETFKAWADDGLNAIDNPAAHMEQARTSMAALRKYIEREVQRRSIDIQNGNPRDDVLTRLIGTAATGVGLPEAELFRACWQFFAAGQETTTALIANSVYLLSEFPEQRARLLADLDLAEQAIEEILRYRSPTAGMPRRCVQDVEIAGVPIAAGSKVSLLFGSANRDPGVWSEPDTFDIMRPLNDSRRKTLAFGSGIHMCLGANLARLEGRIALRRLLERIPDIEVDQEKSNRELCHHFTHGWSTLWVKWTPG